MQTVNPTQELATVISKVITCPAVIAALVMVVVEPSVEVTSLEASISVVSFCILIVAVPDTVLYQILTTVIF